MSGEQQRDKQRSKKTHLDQFPQEKVLTPWERAVLERARSTALRHYNQRLLREEERRKDELFWKRVGAYEASEINKRRQIRHKKSPTRLERYEQLDEERYDRNVRHGIFVEDVLRSEERLKKRAERFGLEQEPSRRVSLSASKLKHRSLVDYVDTIEKLEKRRARFAMEPREDDDYEPIWRSEAIGSSGDYKDEERMLARKKRFGENVEDKRDKNDDHDRNMGSDRGRSRGQSRSRVRRRGGRRNKKAGQAVKDVFVEQGNNAKSDEGSGNGLRVEQDWEQNGEEWGQGQSAQEWERMGESWESVDVGNVGKQSPAGRMPSPNMGLPPDRVFVSAVSVDGDAGILGKDSDEDREKRMEREYHGGRVLQSWEARGESWYG